MRRPGSWQAAGGGEILLSAAVRDAIPTGGFVLGNRGDHQLKGVLGDWTLYALEDPGSGEPATSSHGLPSVVADRSGH